VESSSIFRKEKLRPILFTFNIADARASNIVAQPRNLIYVGEHADPVGETYTTLGLGETSPTR
jgi:hypothetical protein